MIGDCLVREVKECLLVQMHFKSDISGEASGSGLHIFNCQDVKTTA